MVSTRDEPEDSIPVNMVGARRTGWNAYKGLQEVTG